VARSTIQTPTRAIRFPFFASTRPLSPLDRATNFAPLNAPACSAVYLYESGSPPHRHRWEWPMGTAMHSGHYRLPDGGVLRVDFEMGRWVGTLYAPSMTIKTQIVGSDAQVHAWAAGLAA
jgi:hypothetical protein